MSIPDPAAERHFAWLIVLFVFHVQPLGGPETDVPPSSSNA